jgi:hypothetical protein
LLLLLPPLLPLPLLPLLPPPPLPLLLLLLPLMLPLMLLLLVVLQVMLLLLLCTVRGCGRLQAQLWDDGRGFSEAAFPHHHLRLQSRYTAAHGT